MLNLLAYGILRASRFRGALLYGPPGTGKAHLARALVRESKVVTISASGADLVNKYVGDTEKAIKGLFGLAKMLAPSIIFIDEADALFRCRGPSDRSSPADIINSLSSAPKTPSKLSSRCIKPANEQEILQQTLLATFDGDFQKSYCF
jgi:SpoVK/Ycf46/Vps4 family AAA+-type ATPase